MSAQRPPPPSPVAFPADTTIRFASPTARAAFTAELTEAVAVLAARYHDDTTPGGRPHRLVVAAYPAPPETERKTHADEL